MAHATEALDLSATIEELRTARSAWRAADGRHRLDRFPSLAETGQAVDDLVAALFPGRLGMFTGPVEREDAFVETRLRQALARLQRQVECEFSYWQEEAVLAFDVSHAAMITGLFIAELGPIRALVDDDVRAAFLGDPAARSADEILICYPGVVAILYHRIAHALYGLGAPIVARIISELANNRTGIDIHPGATIGRSFFIDHGTGVVIGETAIVGDRVQIYQHVTLGARSPLGVTDVSARERLARHPIVEDDVVIYAGATILGRITIGRGATIGGNVWLLEDVPAGSVVAQPTAVILAGEAAGQLHETLRGRAA
ncbi:serine acetyltransferase [Sphingomonas sp. HMP9]|uniref:serine O-acetyltransferase EpsC n=1 Tax=Sphingomonas sp. HMP9 TaxID=1517554 RepID=UPI00159657EF|nr:serine O-acetyltransferase EpsC [Sphingomonas sp. HMP9]BCA61524.1 serine acetyltransferase [Sphingomonas sp. HMP9]